MIPRALGAGPGARAAARVLWSKPYETYEVILWVLLGNFVDTAFVFE